MIFERPNFNADTRTENAVYHKMHSFLVNPYLKKEFW